MRQSRLVLFGGFELAIPVVLVAVFGPVALTGSPVVPLLVVAGVLSLLSGVVSAIEFGGVTATWRHLVGASYVLFATWPLLLYGPDLLDGRPMGEDLLMFGVGFVTACCIGFMGVDVARDGPHFEVTSDVERVLSL